MLKRMLALTLAAIMAIMPMTASAVTWGEVVNGLNASGSYSKDNVEATLDSSGFVEVIGSGTITGDANNVILITPDTVNGGYSYYFNGVKLNADQVKVEVKEDGSHINMQLGTDTVVNGDVVSEVSGEYSSSTVENYGTITGDMNATANEGGYYADNYNYGVVTGDMNSTAASDYSDNYNYNYGEVGGDMTATASGKDSSIENKNGGYDDNTGETYENATVGGDMTVTGEGGNMNYGTAGDMTVTGEGSNMNYGTAGDMTVTVTGEEAYGGNYNDGIAGDMTVTASGKDSSASQSNSGTVTGDMTAIASGEDSSVNNYVYSGTVAGDMSATASGKDSFIDNYVDGGTVAGSMNAEANAEGALVWNNAYESEIGAVTSAASNGGTVVNTYTENELDSLTNVIGEGGTIVAGTLPWDEENYEYIREPQVDPDAVNAKNVTIVIEAGAADTYTAEQIKAMIAATGMEPTETVYYTVNGDGERTAEYSIGTDGGLTFVRHLIQPLTDEEIEYIKKMDKIARENHERELKRHAEKLGGITASPEWVKQLFLGYMSLNLRMYEEGEQILFRERLAWADTDDGTLNLTLRVNIDEPKALTIRLDENVLDKLEQANISVVTLLAKDSTPVMQYKVSDLRGAYTQYDLSGADLLVVGGADDDVMKIGADGVMKPVEAE